MNDAATLLPVTISLTRASDGKTVQYDSELYQHMPEHDGTFIWEDGNFSCDCNRYLFFERALGKEEPEIDANDPDQCSSGQYRVNFIKDRTGKVWYREAKDWKTSPGGLPKSYEQGTTVALSNAYQNGLDVLLHVCIAGSSAPQTITYDLSKQVVRDAYTNHVIPAGAVDWTSVTAVKVGVPGIAVPFLFPQGITISSLGHILTINFPAYSVQGEDDMFIPVRLYW